MFGRFFKEENSKVYCFSTPKKSSKTVNLCAALGTHLAQNANLSLVELEKPCVKEENLLLTKKSTCRLFKYQRSF